MGIELNDMVHYLIGRGVVNKSSIIDGDITIVDIIRRNKNIKVQLPNENGYFIKQANNTDFHSKETLSREAKCYLLSNSDDQFLPLKNLMPSFVDYNSTDNILIIELLSNSENLKELHYRLGNFDEENAAKVGEILGNYHKTYSKEKYNFTDNKEFPELMPWIFSFPDQGQNQFPQFSKGNQEIQNIINRYPDFKEKLIELKKEWQFNGLIHGDLKLDNIVIHQDANGDSVIKIVDWELIAFGDIAWDVASIFQAYLTFWILNLQKQNFGNQNEANSSNQFSLPSMQDAINSFWKAYVINSAIEKERVDQFLMLCVRYSAVKMIQAALESSYYSNNINQDIINTLQASLNILSDPNHAIIELYRIKR